jgi:hypothetical protein
MRRLARDEKAKSAFDTGLSFRRQILVHRLLMVRERNEWCRIEKGLWKRNPRIDLLQAEVSMGFLC